MKKELAWLDKGIQKIIIKFEYPYYLVNRDKSILCSCIDYSTKQGDPTCKRCLGTGNKIKIKKVRGASMDSSASFKNYGIDESSLALVYYQHEKYKVTQEDLLIDDDRAYIVARTEKKRGTNKDRVYNQLFCVAIKTNSDVLLSNFYEIVERK